MGPMCPMKSPVRLLKPVEGFWDFFGAAPGKAGEVTVSPAEAS